MQPCALIENSPNCSKKRMGSVANLPPQSAGGSVSNGALRTDPTRRLADARLSAALGLKGLVGRHVSEPFGAWPDAMLRCGCPKGESQGTRLSQEEPKCRCLTTSPFRPPCSGGFKTRLRRNPRGEDAETLLSPFSLLFYPFLTYNLPT